MRCARIPQFGARAIQTQSLPHHRWGGGMGDGGGEGGGGGGVVGGVGASYRDIPPKIHSMRSGSWRQAAKAGG